MSVRELFCAVDDFCQQFESAWHQYCVTHGMKHRNRARPLALREIMTILIVFHQSHYRTCKAFYTKHVCVHLCREFPSRVSYHRFVAFFPSVLLPLGAYLSTRLGACSGISFIDSTALAVCHNRCIQQHRVFRGLAARGKTADGWFFGFKVHLPFNDQGALLNFTLTPGNIDDRTPVPALARHLFGKLFGDKGYLSQALAPEIFQRFGVELITPRRSNMKQVVRSLADTVL